MGLCRPSDITTSTCHNHVLNYKCTKFGTGLGFGTNIVGEMCTNSVT